MSIPEPESDSYQYPLGDIVNQVLDDHFRADPLAQLEIDEIIDEVVDMAIDTLNSPTADEGEITPTDRILDFFSIRMPEDQDLQVAARMVQLKHPFLEGFSPKMIRMFMDYACFSVIASSFQALEEQDLIERYMSGECFGYDETEQLKISQRIAYARKTQKLIRAQESRTPPQSKK